MSPRRCASRESGCEQRVDGIGSEPGRTPAAAAAVLAACLDATPDARPTAAQVAEALWA